MTLTSPKNTKARKSSSTSVPASTGFDYHRECAEVRANEMTETGTIRRDAMAEASKDTRIPGSDS